MHLSVSWGRNLTAKGKWCVVGTGSFGFTDRRLSYPWREEVWWTCDLLAFSWFVLGLSLCGTSVWWQNMSQGLLTFFVHWDLCWAHWTLQLVAWVDSLILRGRSRHFRCLVDVLATWEAAPTVTVTAEDVLWIFKAFWVTGSHPAGGMRLWASCTHWELCRSGPPLVRSGQMASGWDPFCWL